jgi:hypothetical protein
VTEPKIDPSSAANEDRPIVPPRSAAGEFEAVPASRRRFGAPDRSSSTPPAADMADEQS